MCSCQANIEIYIRNGFRDQLNRSSNSEAAVFGREVVLTEGELPLTIVEPGGGGGWKRVLVLFDIGGLKYVVDIDAFMVFIGMPLGLVWVREPRELMLFIRLDVKSVVFDVEEKFMGGRTGTIGACCGVRVEAGRRRDGMVWDVGMVGKDAVSPGWIGSKEEPKSFR